MRLNVDDCPAEIYLKLENLQPIGSFKIRGASNRMALALPAELERGVWTASAGNMAQGVAWNADLTTHSPTPVLVVSPNTTGSRIDGAQGVLPKPFEVATLLGHVSGLLRASPLA